jgi:hypothetical protein
METRAKKLRELNFNDYDEYLASPHWQDLRKRFSDAHKERRCYACGRIDGPLDLHHRSYERLGRESLDDLVRLCPDDYRAVRDVDNWADDLWLATDYVRLRHLDPQWQTLKPAADVLFAPKRTDRPPTTPPLAAPAPPQLPAPPPRPPTITTTSDQSHLGWAALGVLLIASAGWIAAKFISAIAFGSSLNFLLPWPTH